LAFASQTQREEEGKRQSRIGAQNSLRKCTQRFRLLHSFRLKLYSKKLYMLYTIEHFRRRDLLQLPRWCTHSGLLPIEHVTTFRADIHPTRQSAPLSITDRSPCALEYSPLVAPWVGRKLHLRRQAEPHFCFIELRVRRSAAVIRVPEAVQACHEGGSVQSGSGALRAALPTAMNQV
jgi:hypothetical protein